jgi:hypothetical protein
MRRSALLLFTLLTISELTGLIPVVSAHASNPFERETRYTQEVQSEALSYLEELYGSAQTLFTYAGFTHLKPGPDQGYGLHVVRRLETGDKLILVNEHWPYQKGRILLPEEIRIRARVPKSRTQTLGKDLEEVFPEFLVARYRVAWDENGKPHLYEETGFIPDGRHAQKRVTASVLNCRGCHNAGSYLNLPYIRSPKDYERGGVIIPSSYYKEVPLDKTKGYLELNSYLLAQKETPERIERFRSRLIDHAKEALELPGLIEAIQEKRKLRAFDWLIGGDIFKDESRVLGMTADDSTGFYRDAEGNLMRDRLYHDVLESLFGKFHYWNYNPRAIPNEE